jgi:hypothetical protein
MHSDAPSVQAYLDELPADRREIVAAVRDVVNRAMPDGYREDMAFGMISWSVPLERFASTYNKQPLAYVSLASQKRHLSLYLMGLYADSEAERTFRSRWTAGGRRLDMGKSCLRFGRLEDLDLDLVAAAVAATPVDEYVAHYERARSR